MDAAQTSSSLWRPFATAPKDGSPFVAIKAGKHPTLGIPYIPSLLAWRAAISNWRDLDPDQAYSDHTVFGYTHWMPLPDANSSECVSTSGPSSTPHKESGI